VTEERGESNRWPESSASATRLSITRNAGIPMLPDDQIIDALNLYSAESCYCSDEDIALGVHLGVA
jgi:hypothetical protein